MFVRTLVLTGWVLLASLLALPCAKGAEADGAEPEGEVAAEEEGAVAGEDQEDRAEEAMLKFVHEPWTGDLDGMLQRGLIRVLVVSSKTMYFAEKSRQRGIAYELLTTFQDHINKQYPPTVKHIKTYVAFVPVARDKLLPALLEGRGDLAVSALTITPERQRQVDFSAPFFREINEIVITGPVSPELKTLDDLAGQQVFVRRSSSYWEHLERLNRRFNDEGKEPIQLEPAPEQLEDEDLMEMLNAGLSGIIVVDDYKAELWAKVFAELKLHPELTINSGGDIGWMMRKDSPKLKAEVDAFAKAHGQGTSVGNTLIRRYVGSDQFVRSATAPNEIEKFDKVVDLFKKYAAQYDLDYRLMIAQGYQESRLDQNAKSSVGAVGIMQLMPETGKEMEVGNIRELEPNIHAGIKYIRHVIDRYFEDEPMDPLNETLFAFAAYNAGPGRVRGLRKTAEKAGLDPNVWLDNVEQIAAKKIGAETVSYVSNIFKYYIAYKLVTDEEEARRQAKDALNPDAR